MAPMFLFINIDTSSIHERSRNSQIARSHVAKRNQRKRKVKFSHPERNWLTPKGLPPLEGSTETQTQIPGTRHDGYRKKDENAFQGSTTSAPRSKDRNHRKSASGHHKRRGFVASGNILTTSKAWTPDEEHRDRAYQTTTTKDDECLDNELQQIWGAPNINYTQPSFRTTRPTCATLQRSTWAQDYFLNVILPSRLSRSRDGLTAWYASFCTDELTYHAMSIAAGVCRGIINDELEWTESPEMLIHKARAIKLVRQQLSASEQRNTEWLIYAILCIARAVPQKKDRHPHKVLPFVPHIPHANWTNVYERVELTKSHCEAMYELLQRHGGIEKLKTPGLAVLLALVDLAIASKTLRMPRLQRFWEADMTSLRMTNPLRMPLSSLFGLGFVYSVPGGLPQHAATTFLNLTSVDVALAQDQHQETDNQHFGVLLNTRNAIHHDLLSLPPWDDLDDKSKAESYPTPYELCRTTCVLYSNAVLLGLPPHSGWHLIFVGRLRLLLELSSFGLSSKEALPLVTWVLFVGGIASYRSTHRQFFEERLRDTLLKRDINSWGPVRQGLREFIWSDSACNAGAAVLWDALDLPYPEV